MFPQPVGSFAGRRAELDRIRAHIDHDNLFFVYGVGGIGKSELIYQLMRELAAEPRWADATPVLIDVRPGTTAPRVLAQLLATLGSGRAPRRGQPTEQAHLSEQLELVARRLDERRHLLFLDDVHHLPPAEVAEALGYLARHVRQSRLLVASRRELRLPPGAPPPVITNLGPLDASAAEAMMTALASRLQVPRLAPEQLMRSSHGSPFHIHRLLVRHAPETGSLDDTLAELPATARRLLLAASVAQHRPALATVGRALPELGGLDDAVRELEQAFLVDLGRGDLVVHDLVREALLAHTDAAALAAAHDDAAALCQGALVASAPPPLLLAVDAIHHRLAAGRPAEAWRLIERWHSALAAAGSEHLLQEPLQRLRAALPTHEVAIDLLVARGLVRASLVEQASRVLAQLGAGRSDAEEARFAVLAGEIAQRTGDLPGAERLFARAVACAHDPDARFQAQLQGASTAIFAGEGDRARALLAAALAELGAPTPRQRARAAWALAVSWMFDERYERAAEEAHRARAALPPSGHDDLANQLAMAETLASIECNDMPRARRAAGLIDEAGLRARVAALYRAIVRHADGDAAGASVALLEAHDYLRGHGDSINAYIAGYHGSAALAELGMLGEAQAMAQRSAELAERAGLRAPAARSLAQQALFAAEAVQCGTAHALADRALASPHLGPRSRAKAHCAHAHAFTIEGDIARALEHVAHARAAIAAPELAGAHLAIDIEHAAIDLVGGNLEHAVARAERVVADLRRSSRDYDVAKAQLVLAAAHVARGRRSDLVVAQRTLAEARGLADAGKLRSIQVGCAILSAALARREHRDRAAHELLSDALRELDPERGSVYAGTLMAALDSEGGSGIAARVVPGAMALLAHLGFTETVDCYLIDQHGRRAATAGDVARERELRDLVVDELRAVIVARRGQLEITGRPMLCTLLSALIQARGAAVPPDALYRQVWGVAEYHPLQHRNTLYVAINRLRSCLREAFPARELIERAGAGWRLADGVDACVLLAVRKAS